VPQFVAAIDNGSQSTKVSIIDEIGRVHASAQRALLPSVHPAPGQVVHPGDDVWDSIAQACAEAMDRFTGDARQIVAVGLCTIRFCRAVLTEQGLLAEPMLSWMDDRVSRPYVHLDNGARYVTTSSGYITHRLTGNFVDTAANYQGVWPIDQQTWRWSAQETAFQTTGMPQEMLLDLVDPGELLGQITPAAALACGLPVGINVYATANDKAVEALGCGVQDEDTILVSLGTYIAAMAVGAELRTGSDGAFWSNFGSIPGRFLYESGGIRRGMWTVSWFIRLVGETAAQLNTGAAQVPVGSGGLMAVLDWLAPGDHSFRKGALLGFDGTQGAFHLYRAILEAIALTMRQHVAAMNQQLERSPTRLVISGGGAQSDLMMQIFADVFDMPAIRMKMNDAAGLGAALCAAVGSGIHASWDAAIAAMVHQGESFLPRDDSVAAYQKLAVTYDGLREYTDPLFKFMAGA